MSRSQAETNAAPDRVRARIAELLERRGMTQRDLVKRVRATYGMPRSEAWLTEVLKGRQDLRLADLDAIADGLNVSPGELVRRNDTELMEVWPTERRLLLHLRALPGKIRDQWFSFQEYMLSLGKEASGAAATSQMSDIPFRPDLARPSHRPHSATGAARAKRLARR